MNQIVANYAKHYNSESNFQLAVEYYWSDVVAIIDNMLDGKPGPGAREQFDACRAAFYKSAAGSIVNQFDAYDAISEYEKMVFAAIDNDNNDDEEFWTEYGTKCDAAKRAISELPFADVYFNYSDAIASLIEEFERIEELKDATIYDISGVFLYDDMNEYQSMLEPEFCKALEFDVEQFAMLNEPFTDDLFNDMFSAPELPADLIDAYNDWRNNKDVDVESIWRKFGIVKEGNGDE